MNWLIAFCVVCWLIGALVSWQFRRVTVSCVSSDEPVTTSWLHLPIILLSPVWVPLAAVWIAVKTIGCLANGMRVAMVAQRYREPQFQPVNVNELEAWIAEGWAAPSAEFLDCGFELVGDYHNKPEPVDVYDRYFLGIEGTVVGSVTALLGSTGMSAMTLLADGTYIETAAMEPIHGPAPEPADLLCLVYAGDTTVRELLEKHLAAVCQEAARRQTQVLAYGADDVPAMSVYGSRLFWLWRQKQGDETGAIPAPTLPIGREFDPKDLHSSSPT